MGNGLFLNVRYKDLNDDPIEEKLEINPAVYFGVDCTSSLQELRKLAESHLRELTYATPTVHLTPTEAAIWNNLNRVSAKYELDVSTQYPYASITYNEKENNEKENYMNNAVKNVLFLAPGPHYAKTVIENQAKTLDRKKIPYNASTKFSDMYLRTDKVNMEVVYADPIKWTADLFKNRDAVFGKKVLVDKAMDTFRNIRINRPYLSLSAYFNQAHAEDLVETIKPRETYIPEIKNTYFNDPMTVVIWEDGTKTMVRCQNGDEYSPETGLALCIAKKSLGNMPNFNNVFKKWLPEVKEEPNGMS